MENLEKLHDLTLKIKSIIYSLDFKENDVRKAYFENLFTIVNEFYTGKVFFRIALEIKNGTIKFDQDIYPLRKHILRIYEIADHPILANQYHNELNKRLFTDTFTNFENTISLCFQDIITDSELQDIVIDLNSKIIKLTKNLPDEDKEQLILELKKNAFIPISRKFRYLSKLKDSRYPGDVKSNLLFIEFCSKLRNCLSHSAGYYSGKDFNYEFENINFIFKRNAFLNMEGFNDYVFIKINEKLSNIINNLNACMEDIAFIQYPDDGF